jgi:hypothetical protein
VYILSSEMLLQLVNYGFVEKKLRSGVCGQ